jgi:hypothetical protein
MTKDAKGFGGSQACCVRKSWEDTRQMMEENMEKGRHLLFSGTQALPFGDDGASGEKAAAKILDVHIWSKLPGRWSLRETLDSTGLHKTEFVCDTEVPLVYR